MTVTEIQARVEIIKHKAEDYEVAHGLEDELYIDVLQAIADGYYDPCDLAEAALQSQKIEFKRVCA